MASALPLRVGMAPEGRKHSRKKSRKHKRSKRK